MKNILIGFAALVILIVGAWFVVTHPKTAEPITQEPVATSTNSSLTQTYTDSAARFSIRYAPNMAVDKEYQYTNLGPSKTISGVKFTIDPAVATGTNLSSDSYLSVEQISNVTSCTADLFIDTSNGAKATTVTDGSVSYSVATTTGAGAGNRYEETVFALPGTSPCIAVRYMIHYGVFENYPAGSIKEFDRAALLDQFDQMRRTLTVNK
ncbi:MAG: hypothetical protein JWO43_199 [Candidatus Adlerbacteria bacterium]|nr:hypothetical protein [Candidatus Adlerbacteria bacterium]